MLQAARSAAARRSTTSTCAAAISRRCRSTTSALDAATLMLVLHHLPEPATRAARKSRACSSRAAALLVVDMLPHDRESYRQQMGHVWLGFSEEHMADAARDAGFDAVSIVALPPDPKAKGPALFVAAHGARQRQHGRATAPETVAA